MTQPELYIIRHAVAGSAPQDHQRPLTVTGMAEFDRLLERCDAKRWPIEHILCSTALRTRQTMSLLLMALSHSPQGAQFLSSIYEAPARALLQALSELPADCASAALVGHNPGVSQLLQRLTGGDPIAFTPGTVAHLALSDTWADIGNNACKLISVHRPEGL